MVDGHVDISMRFCAHFVDRHEQTLYKKVVLGVLNSLIYNCNNCRVKVGVWT